MKLHNKNLDEIGSDNFYHLGFDTETTDVKKLFHDVKFVCLSGSQNRITNFAKFINNELQVMKEDELVNLCHTDRYVLYKIGPVLAANHGMGVPSSCIILNELFKLLHYAGAKDVMFFRMGTCGGLGVSPGTVVLTRKAVNGFLQPKHTQIVLGELKEYATEFEHTLAEDLFSISKEMGSKFHFGVEIGDTMCCDDFYEGQARLDGAFCPYTKQEKQEFLQKAYQSGVRNIEMESLVFASMCNRAKVPACVICSVLVNRLDEGDQIKITKDQVNDFSQRPWNIVLEYIIQNTQNGEH